FDYQSATDFKLAGIDVNQSVLQIGHANASGWVIDGQLALTGSSKLSTGTDYKVTAMLNGKNAKIVLNNSELSYTFADALNDGMIGLGARNSSTSFDSYQVQQPPTLTTFAQTTDFTDPSLNRYLAQTGAWTIANGVYTG